ncbi:MAG: hypothetical protein IPJ56_07550 [Gemmatimonadetes bacterium]|nr:hypothetical protein [Gemmatimonadota bacterium]
MLERAKSLGSQISFALGAVWAVAGAGKLLFGERITIPILPALDLTHVDGLGAIAVALGCFAAAAWMGRHATTLPVEDVTVRANSAHDLGSPLAASAGSEDEKKRLRAHEPIGYRVSSTHATPEIEPLPVLRVTPRPSSRERR